MPTIAEVDGIRIMIFPFDHDPPHVHAFGADFRVKLAINDGRVLETRGTVGPAVMRRLRPWVLKNRSTLNQLWASAAIQSARSRNRPVHRITRAQANADFTVDLQFEDGRHARVDLSDLVQSATVAGSFRDPACFVRELTIAEDGDVLRWSEQFELHADSLRYRAFPEELERDYGARRGGRGRPAA